MLEGLIDDLQDFGMCGDEFFVIDQIRAVDIINAIGKLEQERDRLKEHLERRSAALISCQADLREALRSIEAAQ